MIDVVAVRRAMANPSLGPPLKPAERAVVVRAMAAAGASDAQIGDRLGVTDRTVLRWRPGEDIPAGRRRPARDVGGVEWAEAAAASRLRSVPADRRESSSAAPALTVVAR